MRTLRLAGLLFILACAQAFAALHFPELTGRVVDEAHILSPKTIAGLDQRLAEYEHGTAKQLVVVTLPSLQGATIEEYGYQLGRHWGIGQKGENNGALLIVAPNEHQVRIEVGYGLEPLLTDAASSTIINGIILPQFRRDHMEQGIVEGVDAMLTVLGGKSVHVANNDEFSAWQVLFILLVLLWFFKFSFRHPFLSAYMLSNASSRFGSSRIGGGWGGGGFSGGGGSFGGGGASGRW